MAYTAWSVAQDEVPDATKWNYLGGNDAHFYSFLGDNLEWQSWTPTWSGITVGNSTTTAYYTRVGNTVFCRLRFVKGSTGVMTSTPIFTLPFTAHSHYVNHLVGAAYIEDYLAVAYPATTRIITSTTGAVFPMDVSGSYMQNSGVSTTGPFTWGTGDYFSLNITYEAA